MGLVQLDIFRFESQFVFFMQAIAWSNTIICLYPYQSFSIIVSCSIKNKLVNVSGPRFFKLINYNFDLEIRI